MARHKHRMIGHSIGCGLTKHMKNITENYFLFPKYKENKKNMKNIFGPFFY